MIMKLFSNIFLQTCLLTAALTSLPLASIQAATGWTKLFDGHSTAAWRGYGTNAFPSDCWVVERGTLKTVPGHEHDLITREQYQDFELELEWRAGGGEGQRRINPVTGKVPAPAMIAPQRQKSDDENTNASTKPPNPRGAHYDRSARPPK